MQCFEDFSTFKGGGLSHIKTGQNVIKVNIKKIWFLIFFNHKSLYTFYALIHFFHSSYTVAHSHITYTHINTHINSHYLISFLPHSTPLSVTKVHVHQVEMTAPYMCSHITLIYVLTFIHSLRLSGRILTNFLKFAQILFFSLSFHISPYKAKNEDFISEILTSYKRVFRVTLAVLFLHTSHTAFQAPQLNRAKALWGSLYLSL